MTEGYSSSLRSPSQRPPVRPRTPREHVWSMRRNDKRYDCDFVGHGEYGWEVLFSREGEWFYCHQLQTRALAEAKADDFKARYLAEGGVMLD